MGYKARNKQPPPQPLPEHLPARSGKPSASKRKAEHSDGPKGNKRPKSNGKDKVTFQKQNGETNKIKNGGRSAAKHGRLVDVLLSSIEYTSYVSGVSQLASRRYSPRRGKGEKATKGKERVRITFAIESEILKLSCSCFDSKNKAAREEESEPDFSDEEAVSFL